MALTVVIGGARSGKSTFAEQLAAGYGDEVLYVATAPAGPPPEAGHPSLPSGEPAGSPTPVVERAPHAGVAQSDAEGWHEMARRIERHRASRPSSWITLEEPLDVARALRAWLAHHRPPAAIIVDCLTMLLTNWLLAADPESLRADEITARMDRLADYLAALPCPVVVVTNETGAGIVPPTPLGRAFRDLTGWSNQIMARRAEKVYVLWAGIPVDIKALDARRQSPSGPPSGQRVAPPRRR